MSSRVIYTPHEPKGIRKAPRQRRNLIFIILGVLVLAGLITGLVYLARWPYLRIKKIEFSGLVALNANDLKTKVLENISGNYARVLPKTFYFLVSEKNIANLLKKSYPRIKDLTVSKKLPDTLQITISERKIFSILCQKKAAPDKQGTMPDYCVFVDKDGVAYEEAPNSAGSLITKIDTDQDEVEIGEQIIDTDLINKMGEAGDELENQTGSAAIAYQLFKQIPNEIRLSSSDGYKIYLNRDDDFKRVFKILKTVLDKEIGDKKSQVDYIDLRFGNKVFYKLKSGATINATAATTTTISATTTPKTTQ